MAVTTWDGSSSTAWGTAANWDTGAVPTASDDVIIPDTSSLNNPTLGAHVTINSLEIQTNGTIVGGGYEITVDGENSSGFAVDNDGIISGNLDLEITTTTATDIDLAGTSGNFQNLKLNDASCDVTMKADCILDGTLIIAAGQLSTGTGGYGFSNLTVAGDCSIAAGATLEGNASSGATVRLYSLTVNGTYSATGGETIITGETSSGRAVDIVGTFTDNSGTLSIQSPMDTLLRWPSSSDVYNLKINDADCIARPTGDNKPVIAGNLTVQQGEFNTLEGGQNHAVTVTKKTYVGNSGAADSATLTCNASDMSLGSGYTSDYALVVVGGGTFVGGTGTHTIGSVYMQNNANAKCTLTSGTTNIDSEYGSASKAINISGELAVFNHGSGTILMNYSGATDIKEDGSTLALNNLTISHASAVVTLKSIVTIAGFLKINSGELNTDSSSNFALTVTGNVVIGDGAGAADTSVLTGNESAITMNSLTINTDGKYDATNQTTTLDGEGDGTNGSSNGFVLYVAVNGTFLHNSGLVLITTNTNTVVYGMEGDDTSGTGANAFNRLQIELTGSSSYYVKLRPGAGTAHVIKGNVTIAEGILQTETDSHTLTIEGDVSIESGGTLGHADHDGNDSFNSLTIASGGTCIASEGTTTLTGRTGGAGTYALENNGTFTHNDGTVAITDADNNVSMKLGSSLYNLELSGGYKKIRDNTTINNDLTVTSGDLYAHSSTLTLTVTGDATIANGGSIGDTLAFTGAMSFGSLTIAAGGEYIPTTATTSITTGNFDITTNTFSLGSGTLAFTGAASAFASATGAVFSAGPGATITGYTTGDKSDFDAQSNFAVVGTVEKLNNNGPGSVLVTGKVLNCTGNFITLHPQQDAAQQLDKSSEADRETTLGRDLDRATELVG